MSGCTDVETIGDLSAITSAMPERVEFPGSILPTDPTAGHLPVEKARDCPAPRRGAGLKLFSREARDVHRRGAAGYFGVMAMEKDLLSGLVQAHLSIRVVTAGLSGPQATADSRVGLTRAASLREAVAGEVLPPVFPLVIKKAVPAVMEEDSMVEDVVKGKPLRSLSGYCLLLAISLP